MKLYFMGWIVQNPGVVGGQPRVRGTRLTVSFVLECLAQGMRAEEIAKDYPGFPPDSLPELLHYAESQ
jgi:uncharacterized protein (DUF433 family)